MFNLPSWYSRVRLSQTKNESWQELMRVTTSLTFDRQLSLALTHSATLTRFKLLSQSWQEFLLLTSNIQWSKSSLSIINSHIHRRTGLMLSRGAVESLPEFLWTIVIWNYLLLNNLFMIFPSISMPEFPRFSKIWGSCPSCLVRLCSYTTLVLIWQAHEIAMQLSSSFDQDFSSVLIVRGRSQEACVNEFGCQFMGKLLLLSITRQFCLPRG